ncbi:hypothetical protein LTR91_010615 [Friedmanniomyces endolithicus]|uniref:F-box domain-containing protein n=1 Tax=Friedmanniomyces endolithicus TaxID=329885 RepID=A0AAN6KIR7_9PEZI|nr:hypothetical protein LTR57_010332 [Friedmanniomyces endolithicus]KAK0971062.1 hypothetical protein LTS01_015522 [Friedmanniomyces endolithicus]KAK0985193.1 hypothetical protein LTR91_010615 [Friedmanniomyces endolithicus]KAK1043617.1 hypothetical protein LTS16_007963 [Friedmanniomyces endolithicus]
MVKRALDEVDDIDEGCSKRLKSSVVDRLSRLSDELILRVLSHLPVAQLVVCQRLSPKYQALAEDDQIWKQQYYERFVRPRANRLPGYKEDGSADESTRLAFKASRWLGEEHLVKRGVKSNWKRQYKLRHNWTRGSAVVSEIPVAEEASIPPVLVQMHEKVVYTADTDGLRAWSARQEQKMVAKISFAPAVTGSPPTALAIDPQMSNGMSRITVGFESGAFSVYILDHAGARFRRSYSHLASSNGVISATAVAWPYVVTMTATQLLSLYVFEKPPAHAREQDILDPPRLLHSLKSKTIWPPLSVSLRAVDDSITVSVAYALPTYLSGWTVGLQEVKVSPAGELIESRLAAAISRHYRPLIFSFSPLMQHLSPPSATAATASTSRETRQIHSKPTSLSYTHPYLLVSHPDNTLTIYLVNSTAESLTIGAGSRLWGHTSSVSGAHVGDRGKAVSVSTRGDELRVWELEGGFASSTAKKRLSGSKMSVRIRPEPRLGRTKKSTVRDQCSATQTLSTRGTGSFAIEQRPDEISELTLTRGWVGFDEENVVVLEEQSRGGQALVVYDFT